MERRMPDMGHNSGIAIDRLRGIVCGVERPKNMRRGVSPSARFLAKICEMPAGCVEWTGSKSQVGYGWFSWNSKAVLAHRWIYEAAYGPIPADRVIDHLCRNRACVNISHLECVSMAENTRRGTLHDLQRAKAKQQTHCKRGHPLFGENVSVNALGHRCCKTCRKAKAAEWKIFNQTRVNELQLLRRAA
jgi:hypothetical protein